MIAVQDLDPGAFRDVARGHNARTLGRNRQALGPFDFHAQTTRLEVQDDVGDIFAHTGNRRELVQHVVDLHGCDRGTLQRDIRTRRSALPMVRPKPRSSGSATTVPDAQDHCPAFTSSCCGLISSAQFLWIMRPSIPVYAPMSNGADSRGFKMRIRGRARTCQPQSRKYRLDAAALWRAAAVVGHRRHVTDRRDVEPDSRQRAQRLSRPEPGPCTSTSSVLTPWSCALRPASSAAICAA